MPPARGRSSTALIHHPYRPPAGFERRAAGGAQGVDGDLPERRRTARAQLEARRAATPTACTARRPPSRSRSASRRSKAACRRCWCRAAWRRSRWSTSALLKAGDEVLLPDNVYGPSKELARNELARWGIAHRFYDPHGPGGAGGGDRRRRPALVWLEAAGSVTMEFPDLPRADRASRARRGVDGRARQHLGRRHRLRRVRSRRPSGDAGRRRHLDPGADQVPVGRRRRADGLGDDARRGAAPAR